MKSNDNSFVAASSERGFTLLELLTSMTLLLVMVGFLAVAFNSASVAWKQGEKDVDRYQQARAAVDLMSRDLSQVVVSPKLQFYGLTNSLAFMAPVSDDPNFADLAEVAYVLGATETAPPFTLSRRLTTAASSQWDVYTQPVIWPSTADNVSVVSDAVINFTVTYYDTNNVPFVSWNSTSSIAWSETYGLGLTVPAAVNPNMLGLPPAYVNLHLEVVDSKTAKVLRTMAANPVASSNLIAKATRAFDVYLRIPQR